VKVVKMKMILCIFKQLPGLKMIFHKSVIFCFGKNNEEHNQYKHIFGVESGSLPFRYLMVNRN
jgi:hypothetical protein